jgi:hypothetical protein
MTQMSLLINWILARPPFHLCRHLYLRHSRLSAVGGNCSGCYDDSGRSDVWIWNLAEYPAYVAGIQSIAEIALDHASGKLSEPQRTHRFF